MQEDAVFQMREVLTCLFSSGLLALSAYIVASAAYDIQSLRGRIEDLRGMTEDMKLRLKSEYSQEFLQTFEGEHGIQAKLYEMLGTARSEVLLLCPWVNEEGVVRRIEQLRVPLRMVLLDPADFRKRKGQLEVVKRLGRRAEIRYHDTLHAKVLLVDRKAMLLGSADFTSDGLEEGLESAVYTEDPVLLRDALRFFEALWEGLG